MKKTTEQKKIERLEEAKQELKIIKLVIKSYKRASKMCDRFIAILEK